MKGHDETQLHLTLCYVLVLKGLLQLNLNLKGRFPFGGTLANGLKDLIFSEIGSSEHCKLTVSPTSCLFLSALIVQPLHHIQCTLLLMIT